MVRFYFVKFDDGSNDIIHESWIAGPNLCLWPPGSCGAIKDLFRNETTPTRACGLQNITVLKSTGHLLLRFMRGILVLSVSYFSSDHYNVLERKSHYVTEETSMSESESER